MKNILKVLVGSLFMTAIVSSCVKDENKIFFEGGTNPVLSATSTSAMVLTGANAANPAITFNWTNPDYRFTTGTSSQDVSYLLQVDTTGANFTSPDRQEVAIARELNIAFTVKELNTILTKLNLLENIPHNVEFRIKSTLNNAIPLYSNVLKVVITPYLDVAVPIPPSGELYITGDGTPSGWTNAPPNTQRFTKLSNTEYTITLNLPASGLFYKFLSTLNQWQPQYGGSSATGGDMGYNMGGGSDPAAIPTPAIAGSYKITANFKTGKYTVVKL